MAHWQIIQNDVKNWTKEYDGDKFHAMLCDCPYEYGHQGKSWDSTGVSFDPETWAGLGEHLYPGAMCMSFAGARTYHRIAVAIEDAGFIVHPLMIGWAYGAGLMKAARIDTQVDTRFGAKRRIIKQSAASYGYQLTGRRWTKPHYVTEPATSLARDWAEHRYGLQVQRPAIEPIVFFQKPYSGKPVESIIETGAGAIWIEGTKYSDEKRWPTNLLVLCTCGATVTGGKHSLSCPVTILDNKEDYFQVLGMEHELYELALGSGDILYVPKASTRERQLGLDGVFWRKDATALDGYVQISEEEWELLDPASRAEGNIHNTVKPISLTRELARMLLPPERYRPRRMLIPFAGVMSEAIGAMLTGWDDIDAIENDPVHCNIGARRMQWWQDKHTADSVEDKGKNIAVQPLLFEG